MFRLLNPGDHVLIGNDFYGGTYRLLSQVHTRVGLECTPVALTKAALLEAWQPTTKMVWVETPSNPLLRIADIAAVAELAHGRDALLVVDNTFATPYLQRPLKLGADVVIHSTTKYLRGHSDVVGGFVATSDDPLAERIAFLQNATGAVPGPFDCFLVLRGSRRLPSGWTATVTTPPGWPKCWRGTLRWSGCTTPGSRGTRAMTRRRNRCDVSEGWSPSSSRGGEPHALAVAKSTSVFTLAESLGAVESLIEHPLRMTHASLSGSSLAIDPALLRLSVGIERHRRPSGRSAGRTRGRPSRLIRGRACGSVGRCRGRQGVGLPQPPTDFTHAWATAAGCSCLAVTSRLSFEMASVVSLASTPSRALATPEVSTELRMTGTM